MTAPPSSASVQPSEHEQRPAGGEARGIADARESVGGGDRREVGCGLVDHGDQWLQHEGDDECADDACDLVAQQRADGDTDDRRQRGGGQAPAAIASATRRLQPGSRLAGEQREARRRTSRSTIIAPIARPARP